MTIQELSQYYHITQELRAYDKRIDELRARRVAISAPSFDKEPTGHRPGAGDSKIETLTAEIIDLEELLQANRERRVIELRRLERYIGSIDDAVVRRIIQLRFVELRSWNAVAQSMSYTVEAVKKRLYRYLEKHPDE